MLPASIERALVTPPLEPTSFRPTRWSSAENKSKFGNGLLRFIAKDMPKTLFTDFLYRRLSNTFGHIAHCDKFGFYGHFFETTTDKIAFLHETLQHPCYGDPEYTSSDIERAVISRLKQANLIVLYEATLASNRVAPERAELTRPKTKYEPVPSPTTTRRQADLFETF
jgi:hypothetical protein